MVVQIAIAVTTLMATTSMMPCLSEYQTAMTMTVAAMLTTTKATRLAAIRRPKRSQDVRDYFDVYFYLWSTRELYGPMFLQPLTTDEDTETYSSAESINNCVGAS